MPFILREEGGYSNTQGDHGGATNFGITGYEYNVYRHSKGLQLQSVIRISPSEYDEIYWTSYWLPHCPSLPVGLDLSFFNIAVNGGTGRAVRLLQQCLGLPIDGIWGGHTEASEEAIKDAKQIIIAFHAGERAFYQSIINYDPSQRKFATDWFGRNDRCEALSLTMAAA